MVSGTGCPPTSPLHPPLPLLQVTPPPATLAAPLPAAATTAPRQTRIVTGVEPSPALTSLGVAAAGGVRASAGHLLRAVEDQG